MKKPRTKKKRLKIDYAYPIPEQIENDFFDPEEYKRRINFKGE